MATKFGKGKKSKDSSSEMETFSVDKAEFEEGTKKKSERGGGGEPVPVGLYEVEVIEAKRDKSTWEDTKGAPEFNLTLRIIDGDPETKKLWAKRQLWMNRSITAHEGKSLPNYFRFLDAIGVPSDSYGETDIPLPSISMIVGAKFMVDVVHKPSKDGTKVFANPFFHVQAASSKEGDSKGGKEDKGGKKKLAK